MRSAELARSALLDAEEAHQGEKALGQERLGKICALERKVEDLEAQVVCSACLASSCSTCARVLATLLALPGDLPSCE